MALNFSFADALSRAAKEIQAAQGTSETLDAIVRTAAESLPDIEHVGITLARKDGSMETLAASDDLVNVLDQLQYDCGEGPCLYAAEAETVVRVEHAHHEQRWPVFIPKAVQHGLRSMLGVQLHLDGSEMAALNLYSTAGDTLDPDLEGFAELFATYASLALGRARREDQLSTALSTRRLIGQAIGIVMVAYRVDEDRAFGYLTRLSNNENIKLRDVAERIVSEANEQARQRKGVED
jgi:GAF domain-containing protein